MVVHHALWIQFLTFGCADGIFANQELAGLSVVPGMMVQYEPYRI